MHPDVWTEHAASELINSRLVARYPTLQTYTEIEYCLKRDPKPEHEQALGFTLAVTLVLACVLGLNARRWILPEFSPPKSNKRIKHFVLFDLYKCFGAVGVVLAHCCLFGSFLMPMKNIELLEDAIGHPGAKFWRLVCPFLMLAFFVMSSMLLTVKLLHCGDPSKRPTFGAIIAHRLIRLVPVNLLMVGFGALVYDRFTGGGPLLSRQLIVEQRFCRSYWWMNVLFISNFNMKQPCLPDSWYVSADMQLYVLIALLLQTMFRFPKHTVAMLTLVTVCSFLGPFLTILWTDFDPVGPSNFHEMRFFLLGSPFMSQLYTPFYNNLAWSVGGLMAGIVYDRFRRYETNTEQQRKILHQINLAIKISMAMLALALSATIDASREGSFRWWLALCYSTYRLSGACFISASFLRISLTETDDYELMPPLFNYENVTKCFEQYPTSAYCVVKMILKPKEGSNVWRAIEHLLSIPSEKEFPQHRSRYTRILNMCVNYHLTRRYNLSGYSELERCVTPETYRPTVDAYHVLFALIVAALCSLVVYASYRDWRNKPALENNNETSATKRRANALWMEFALQRTWAQLVTAPKSKLQRDYAFVEIFRMLSVFIILAIHVSMVYTAGPTANMRLLEEFFGWRVSLIAVSVFPFQVHTFFTISGIMLAVHFLEQGAARANRIGWTFLWKGIVMRYVRIFPVLFVVWLYQVSWFDWFARGPGDYRYFTLERDNLAPIANLYYHKLPGVILASFKHLRFIFYVHPALANDYMLSHPHTCSYFSGLFAGLAYHRYRSNARPLLSGGTAAGLLKWVPPTMVLLQASLAPLFYDLDYSKPMLWNAIYGAVHRCCWGAMCAVGILYGASLWQGRHSWVHFHPLVQLLSKLSFGVFMVQFNVLKSLTQNGTGSGVELSWTILVSIV
uniref:Acyltransferase 3 domain-containing protein n=1 Tax=Anopheles christyi TaxID=43041 RepID=A0A182JNH7_9DIPT